jgi:L-ribulose-5-phosphate 3-epimerase
MIGTTGRRLCEGDVLNRRQVLKSGTMAALANAMPLGAAADPVPAPAAQPRNAPMALGLLIKPFPDPEAQIRLVHELGFPTCFLSLDSYLGKYTPALAKQFVELLQKYEVIATAAEVVHPLPLEWNFLGGPSTIGLVPRAYRQGRMDALRQTSDFAKMIGIERIQTHCGFIPEDPKDPLYPETVKAIRTMAEYCAANGQHFLMETGQETPTTMLRMIKDVNHPALGVGLDTANLILYGKANPVDALKIIGPYVQAMHAKDGKWPTSPDSLGEEVVIGEGDVDFATVLRSLKALHYQGAISIERETSGPQQIADVRAEKSYLSGLLAQIDR